MSSWVEIPKIISGQYRWRLSLKLIIINIRYHKGSVYLKRSRNIKWDIGKVRMFVSEHSECKLISTEYINTKEKLSIECRCGCIFKTTFASFKDKNKRQCHKCSGITIWNIENVREYINSKKGNGCTLLSDYYKNMYTPLSIGCGCGNEYKTNFTSFKNSNTRQCPSCGRKNAVDSRRLSYKTVEDLINNSGSECTLLSKEYKNNSTPLKIRCSCGNMFKTSLANFEYQNTQKCNFCKGKVNWNYDMVRDYVNNKTDCTLITDNYRNIDTLMEFQCPCGNQFATSFSSFRHSQKQTCDTCSMIISKSERRLIHCLTKKGINFETEYRFQDCRNCLPLPFDVAILNSDGDVKLLIESDGRQHFEPVNFGGISDASAKKRFEETIVNDRIKTQYCKDNDIPLLRIPYWEFDNIEEVIGDIHP